MVVLLYCDFSCLTMIILYDTFNLSLIERLITVKITKRIISFSLTVITLLLVCAIDGVFASGDTISYTKGSLIPFGCYPQSRVRNSSIIEQLDESAPDVADWNSFDFYTGTGNSYDGNMYSSDFMKYIDIEIGDGELYRGVYIDRNRMPNTDTLYVYEPIPVSNTQWHNGYKPGNTYWFKYEQLLWRVLNPATGLVLSVKTIDAQAFNNFVVKASGSCYGDFGNYYCAKNYAHSYIYK